MNTYFIFDIEHSFIVDVELTLTLEFNNAPYTPNIELKVRLTIYT